MNTPNKPPSNYDANRPREKLSSLGAKALSDQELLAILLGSGIKGCNVSLLAANLLALLDRRNGELTLTDLLDLKGIGNAKACMISAMLEFVRRRIRPEGIKIVKASDVIPLLTHLNDRKQEHFICISLNGAHEVIATRIVTIGLVDTAHVHPREVLADPLQDRASAVIVAHNHPSGDTKPSQADIQVTLSLKQACNTLGIKLLDHIIFSRRGFISFQEQNLGGF